MGSVGVWVVRGVMQASAKQPDTLRALAFRKRGVWVFPMRRADASGLGKMRASVAFGGLGMIGRPLRNCAISAVDSVRIRQHDRLALVILQTPLFLLGLLVVWFCLVLTAAFFPPPFGLVVLLVAFP